MASPYSDISVLHHIATILIDAQRHYHRAARLAGDDRDAVNRIELILGERSMLLSTIQDRVQTLGETPKAGGTMFGAAQMAFFDVRSVFDRDAKAALADVSRGEAYLRNELRTAIRRTDVSAETRAFLGVALDRVASGEMRIAGKRDEIERRAQ